MIDLISLFQSAEDGNGILYRGLVHHDRLEPAFQSGVFFNVFLILVQCSGTDTVQFTAGEHWFQKVSGIHTALGFSGTDDGMELIDEQDDTAFGFFDLFQYCFQAFLELTTVFGSGDEGAHVQRKDRLVLQTFRHIPANDTLCQPFRDGRFTDTGLTNEHRVVLCFAGQDADHVSNLDISADNRVQFILSGSFYQICSVFCESIVGAFRIVTGDRTGTDFGKLVDECVFCNAVVGKDTLDVGSRIGEDPDHNMFYRQVFVAHALGRFLCCFQNTVRFLRQIDLGVGTAHFRQFCDGHIQFSQKLIVIYSHFGEQRGDETAVLIDESIEQMFRSDILILILFRHVLRGLDHFYSFLSKVVGVHK